MNLAVRSENLNLGQQRSELDGLLSDIGFGKRNLNLAKNRRVYSQGDSSDAVYYVQRGSVRTTVVSASGKEATLLIVGPGDFFGMGCLAGQKRRLGTASTLEPSTLIRIEKEVMRSALRQQPQLFDAFLAQTLNHTVDLQKDLCTQILDSSEKRLLRVLLKLARIGKEVQEQVTMPKISHDALATMVGTTRSRITYFMNKFKKLGFVDYGGQMVLRPALLAGALREED